MRIASTISDSIVDGPGLRFVVFVQGCKHNCKNCHNPQTHDFQGGHEVSIADILTLFKQDTLAAGITFSGGDPFEQAFECAELGSEIKLFRPNCSIWTYTGYIYEQIVEADDSNWNLLLDVTDVLVDGPFIESMKSYECKFRGSRNQRLIDIPATRLSNNIVLYQPDNYILDKFQVPQS